ncbi:tRNA (N(6)-L-threonylcarbamoyladenosine(37)-C(2))-methylthiotransferase [Candidatus Woesearchaeota archaeon]|nr:tRNA (N(6)-L-threonylcarbamoyladenosine(37)-C(2))-methylthiotransferase [Candidatus Woesearchaeota archaeon]
MDKIFFKTSGCSNNQAESEIMKGLTSEYFGLADNIEDAEIVVFNICTVKGDDVALASIKKIKEEFPNKILIIGGCVPEHMIKNIRKVDPNCGILNTHNLDKILEVIEETLNNNPIQVMSPERINKTRFKRIRTNKLIGIIPISNSCLGSCTYCSVKPIKGDYYSFPVEEIVEDIENALKDGCKEIWITSQDNGCYGMDIGTNLVELLQRIVEIPGDYYIRLGMMNPDHIYPFFDELVEVMKDKKFFKFVHIPVQSGSDEVLKKMNRHYTIKQFKEIVSKFREEIPMINIASDMIVGFPEETGKDFDETMKLIKDIQFDVLNVSKFRKRLGTKAYNMEQVDPEVIKQRANRAMTAFQWGSFENNKKWVGWEGIILLDEEGTNNSLVGRNIFYKPIIIPNEDGRFSLGQKLKVKINKCTTFDLRVE